MPQIGRPAVIQRLADLSDDLGISHKKLAGRIGKTRQLVDAAFRGDSNLLLHDAEAIAEELGARLEVVVDRDPVREFQRALDANVDLTDEWRETIWAAFERAKSHTLRMSSGRDRPRGRRRTA